MQKLLLSVFVVFSYLQLSAQNTYTWNVVRGSFDAPGSWSPARNTPAPSDILVFNGSVTPNACATGVSRQTIGQLRIINSANVRLTGGSRVTASGTVSRTVSTITGTGTSFLTELSVGDLIFNANAPATFYGEVATVTSNTSMTTFAAGTIAAGQPLAVVPSLSIGNASNSALDITGGSTLTIGDTLQEQLVIRILTGSKASIQGTVNMRYARQRVFGTDSGSVVVKSGGIIRTDSSFVGNPFTQTGLTNTVIFESGSGFEFLIGSNPFGLTQPASKVFFAKGSNYTHISSSSPASTGRVYANFTMNTSGSTASLSNGSGLTIDTLKLLAGNVALSGAGTTNVGAIQIGANTLLTIQCAVSSNTNVTGAINIASGGKLNLAGAPSPGTGSFNLRGTSGYAISGAGEFRVASSADSSFRFRIQNPSGITLQKSLDLNTAYLDLDSGYINLNNNTISLGSALFHGRSSQLNGTVRGTGSLTRWYLSGYVGAGDSSLFPVGTSGGGYPAWVFGTFTGSGTVTLSSFTESNAVTNFGTPFYDSAVTAGIIVQSRLGHAWALTSGNGLAGTSLGVRVRANVTPGYITNTAQMRITLANGIAPGTVSENGAGTNTQPLAGKLGITAAQLNNTFYMGTNTSTNPLPVKFVQTTVKAKTEGNLLQWTTAQEINVVVYQVEKLNTAGDFEAIADVKATRANAYSYLDEELLGAVYRVKAIDLNGEITYSEIVSIDRDIQAEVTVYPNPVNNWLKIENAGSQIIGQNVKITNHVGKTIDVEVTPDGVDTRDLPSGVYYIQLFIGDKPEVVKFVKR